MLTQALLSNQVDVSSGSLIGFITLWSKTRGPIDVRALAPYNRPPVILVTRAAGLLAASVALPAGWPGASIRRNFVSNAMRSWSRPVDRLPLNACLKKPHAPGPRHI